MGSLTPFRRWKLSRPTAKPKAYEELVTSGSQFSADEQEQAGLDGRPIVSLLQLHNLCLICSAVRLTPPAARVRRRSDILRKLRMPSLLRTGGLNLGRCRREANHSRRRPCAHRPRLRGSTLSVAA